MNSIRQRHLLVLLLVAALALVTLVALVVRRSLDWHAGPVPLPLILVGTGLAYMGLAALYLALGRQNVLLRVLAATGLSVAGGLIAATGEGLREPEQFQIWAGFGLFNAFCVSVPAIYAWARGLRVTHDEHPPLVFWQPKRQFSLWGMLSAMTVLAVVLGVAVRLQFPIDRMATVMALCTVTALITYVVAGTLLNRMTLGTCATASAIAVIISLFPLALVGINSEMGLVGTASQAGVTFLVCYVLRTAGYYLRWPDYEGEETVGPTKRLELYSPDDGDDSKGRDPADDAPAAKPPQSNHSSEQSNLG